MTPAYTAVCRECKREFSPDKDDPYLMACPYCRTEMGHEILTGRELFIANMEAE